MSEDAKTICEKCEGSIKRVITGGTGLIFKGSGFYLTDYKNKPKSKVDKESKTPEKSESKKDGKSESSINNTEKKSTVKKDKKSNE